MALKAAQADSSSALNINSAKRLNSKALVLSSISETFLISLFLANTSS
jgi:hypothetical protein